MREWFINLLNYMFVLWKEREPRAWNAIRFYGLDNVMFYNSNVSPWFGFICLSFMAHLDSDCDRKAFLNSYLVLYFY